MAQQVDPETPAVLTKLLNRKTISSVRIDDEAEGYFTLNFTDGTTFSLRYSWVYEWELSESHS